MKIKVTVEKESKPEDPARPWLLMLYHPAIPTPAKYHYATEEKANKIRDEFLRTY